MKIKNLLATLILTSMAIVTVSSNNINFNTQYLEDVQFEFTNDTTLLPIRNTLESFGLEVLWDSHAKCIKVEKDGFVVEIYTTDKFAVKNSTKIYLNNKIEIIEGSTYIEETTLELLFDLEILANLDTSTMYIFDNSNFAPVFEVHTDIPENVVNKMLNVSLPNYDEAKKLSLLEITYIDLDGNTKIGSMIVKKELAVEVCEIFEKLYEVKFPINSILLIENFNGDDNLSMQANNTSAFNYRLIAGTRKLSNHSYGTCIDINPLFNPHVINNVAYPIEGQIYTNRNIGVDGMINSNDYVRNLFEEYGWSWGGTWQNPDYQHFEKG